MAEKPFMLVIDDNAANRRLMETIFTRQGFRVLTAPDGAEGRLLAQTELPDIILLDIMMPGESGFEACLSLKEDTRTASIPVIFMSAFVSPEDQMKGLALGAADYITKPFNIIDMVARVRKHLKHENT